MGSATNIWMSGFMSGYWRFRALNQGGFCRRVFKFDQDKVMGLDDSHCTQLSMLWLANKSRLMNGMQPSNSMFQTAVGKDAVGKPYGNFADAGVQARRIRSWLMRRPGRNGDVYAHLGVGHGLGLFGQFPNGTPAGLPQIGIGDHIVNLATPLPPKAGCLVIMRAVSGGATVMLHTVAFCRSRQNNLFFFDPACGEYMVFDIHMFATVYDSCIRQIRRGQTMTISSIQASDGSSFGTPFFFRYDF